MKFFWVKLHIEFPFHHRDPYGSWVAFPWIFYYRAYACNSFPSFFSTHISYRNLKLSMRFFWVKLHNEFAFIIVTPMVPELCALRFCAIGHMHVTVFRVFFYTISYRNLKLSMGFFWVRLHIELAFYRRGPYGFGVMCLWIYNYRTYECNSFPGVFFYTVSHRNLERFMRFLCVKLHIEFALNHRDPYGSGVKCPWIFFTIGHMHVTVFYIQKRDP
jgi:hypothetical protein